MDQLARFDPILPAHAIERCAATIMFDQPLPQKPFERLLADFTLRLSEIRLKPAATSGANIEFDAARGQITVNPHGQSQVYISIDNTSQLILFPNMVSWHTTKYVRWAPFRGEYERFLFPLLKTFIEVVSVTKVKLEYWDRFIWTGSPSEIDPWLLLNKNNGLLANSAVRPGTAWHSHCGWFEQLKEKNRRLVNVNIDVVDLIQSGRPTTPSIGIYTMMQDDLERGDEASTLNIVSESLTNLHEVLKGLFASIILDTIADRIALKAEKRQ